MKDLYTIIDQLSDFAPSERVFQHISEDGATYPSSDRLREMVTLIRSIVFPGFFGNSEVGSNTLRFHIGVNIERLMSLLEEQILAGFRLDNAEGNTQEFAQRAKQIAGDFIDFLPTLRQLLITDVEAAYNGDPAAKSFTEIILCYPAIKAISNYRIAHQLLVSGVPLIPRIITEMAHSETGIDIHPGAKIGSHFTIDHGTGVVIGETSIIGSHVTLYQGVTLGAKSFPLDKDGNPIKNLPRHPILEDHVIVYSNASILGRITIGEGAVIGGNLWITNDVAPDEKVIQYKPTR